MTSNQRQGQPAVYILANRRNGTQYTGVTADLVKRIHQHKTGITKGFAARYGCDRLVHFALFDAITDAIAREKQIKPARERRRSL